jgi:hypothetical protein
MSNGAVTAVLDRAEATETTLVAASSLGHGRAAQSTEMLA